MIYDITRTVTPRLAVWPGDTQFTPAPALLKQNGSSVNLFTLTLSAHTGTHADAYYHYDDTGAHPAAMPFEHYIGAARVITVSKRAGALMPADLGIDSMGGVQRLLIHSHVSDSPDDQFPTEFPYLSVELVDWLANQGVLLIGLDSPSMDDLHSKELPCHHRIKHHGMVNLETVQLRGVPDGIYELIALPLKLDGVCGSPVRAILRTLDAM